MFAAGKTLFRDLQMGGRWRDHDHGLHQGVCQGGLQIGRRIQPAAKRTHVRMPGPAGDRMAQFNAAVQVMQAAQMGHGARAYAYQGDAHSVVHAGILRTDWGPAWFADWPSHFTVRLCSSPG